MANFAAPVQNATTTPGTDQVAEALRAQIDPTRVPQHVAIIMDGNGRWARRQSLGRIEGHKQGRKAVETVVDRLLASPHHGERWGRHFMDIWRYCDWWGLDAQLRYSQSADSSSLPEREEPSRSDREERSWTVNSRGDFFTH